VGSSDFPPDYPDLRALSLGLGPVDENNLLSQVEGSILRGGNALNLDEGSAGVGIALAPLVRKVAGLDVQSVAVLRHLVRWSLELGFNVGPGKACRWVDFGRRSFFVVV